MRSTMQRGGLVVTAGVLAALVGGCQTTSPGPDGFAVAVLGDADLANSNFVDGAIGPSMAEIDTLTVVRLPLYDNDGDLNPAEQIRVTNSVLGPPKALAVTPDSRFLIISESRGPAPMGATNMRDLPAGSTLSSVWIGIPEEMYETHTIAVDARPTSVSVHPSQRYIAVATGVAGRQITIVPFDDGVFSTPWVFELFGVSDSSTEVSSLTWSPDGRLLAATLPRLNQVVFYEFNEDADGAVGLRVFGRPVPVTTFPYGGVFSPDGRHFFSTDLQWGEHVGGYFIEAPDSRVSVIRVSDERPAADADPDAVASQVLHEVVWIADVPANAEGIAVSPDGRHVATASFVRGFFSPEDGRYEPGVVTLMSFDGGTGELTTIDQADVQGMPEGLAFDTTGSHLAVTLFRSWDAEAIRPGEIVIFPIWGRGADASIGADDAMFLGTGAGPHEVIFIP